MLNSILGAPCGDCGRSSQRRPASVRSLTGSEYILTETIRQHGAEHLTTLRGVDGMDPAGGVTGRPCRLRELAVRLGRARRQASDRDRRVERSARRLQHVRPHSVVNGNTLGIGHSRAASTAPEVITEPTRHEVDKGVPSSCERQGRRWREGLTQTRTQRRARVTTETPSSSHLDVVHRRSPGIRVGPDSGAPRVCVSDKAIGGNRCSHKLQRDATITRYAGRRSPGR